MEAARNTVPAVDTAFVVRGRDVTIGGNLLASAIAYRLFLWMLPFALVLSAGLGFLRSASEKNPNEAAHDLGLSAYVASVVSDASEQAERSRWIVLAIGLWALFVASSAGAKTFTAVHGLVWGDSMVRTGSKAKAAGGFMLCLLAALLIALAAQFARRESPGLGISVTVAVFVAYVGLALVISLLLPHADAPWTHLLPGAAFAAFGFQVVHLVTVFYLSEKVTKSSALYGGLGAAATILLWLYLIGRLMVGSAVLNATLWERAKERRAQDAGPA